MSLREKDSFKFDDAYHQKTHILSYDKCNREDYL